MFIAYRAAPVKKGFKYMVGGSEIDMTPIAYAIDEDRKISILSKDIVDSIRTTNPGFQPCAYLNGTERPDHFKWLVTLRVGTKKKIYGYGGPKLMELSQTLHHLMKGSYLAYTDPGTLGRARSMLALSPLDGGLARTAGAYLRDVARAPWKAFSKLHMQSVMIIQPADMMGNGALSMCDGCPDITVYDNKLVWSCRMEELINFGDWIRPVPVEQASA